MIILKNLNIPSSIVDQLHIIDCYIAIKYIIHIKKDIVNLFIYHL